MGSPITFSGFNQIDFNMILNAVMQQERQPLTALESRKTDLEAQNTTFGTFLSKLTTLESAAEALAEADSFASVSASSSDDGVGVSTTSATVEGTYDVVVSQLARAQVTASASTYSSVDTVVGATGTLTLLVASQPPVDVAITPSMTLKQLAEAINAKTDAPVTASVVQAAPGSYRLVLTGKNTGAANAFTMTSTVAGGLGLAFDDVNGNGIYGEDADNNTQKARNASLTVNNLQVTSASNNVEDVIPGVTLKLTREDATKTATVKVTRDSSSISKLLDKLVSSYNDVVTFFKDQNTAAVAGRANIARDPLLGSFKNSLREAMLGEYLDGGTYSRLASVGVEFDITGKLKINKTKLDEALADSSSSVQKLFAGADGKSGVFGKMRGLVEEYTKSGGFVATVRQRIGDQVTSIGKRLDKMEAQLAVRRAALQQEYIAADMAMSQIKAQSSSLSAIGSQYRLF
jgi:flagellar hook-associated protein 2